MCCIIAISECSTLGWCAISFSFNVIFAPSIYVCKVRQLDGSLEHFERVITAIDKATLSCLPVDDLPDVVDVGGLSIEVLQQR